MIKTTVLSDMELVLLFKEGNDDAYKEIYKRYWGVLFQHVKRMAQCDEVAKDIVQDVFTALWLKRDVLDVKQKLSAYLYSAVRYKMFDFIDKNKVRGNYLESLASFIEKGEYTTDDFWLQKELAKQIENEIDALPVKMREVFLLSREFDLSHNEIAEKLNISNQTVKKQIHNALKILRPKFGWYIIVLLNLIALASLS